MENAEISKKKFYKQWWFWVLIVVGFVALISSSAGNNGESPAPANGNTPSVAQSATATVPSGPVSSFGDGNYIVGTDIVPGTYKSSGSPGCYWERLRGFGGTNSDIIANDNTDYPAVVTIAATDKGFDSNRCGTWTRISTPTLTTTKKTSVPASNTAPSQPQTYTTPSGAVVSGTGQTVSTPAPALVTQPVQTQPPPPPASWHTVATFSGSGSTNTNTFSIHGSKWKIDWTLTPTNGAADFCQQYTCSANFQIHQGSNGSYVDQFTPEVQSTLSGTSYEYNETGSFYFSIVPGNVSWNLTVEDYY